MYLFSFVFVFVAVYYFHKVFVAMFLHKKKKKFPGVSHITQNLTWKVLRIHSSKHILSILLVKFYWNHVIRIKKSLTITWEPQNFVISDQFQQNWERVD